MDLDSAETAIVRLSYARPPKNERGDPRDPRTEARRSVPSGPRGGYDHGPSGANSVGPSYRSSAPEPAPYGSGSDTRSHGGGSSFDRDRAGGPGGPGGGYDREPRGGPRPSSRATGFSDRPVGGYPERGGDGPERGSTNLSEGPGGGYRRASGFSDGPERSGGGRGGGGPGRGSGGRPSGYDRAPMRRDPAPRDPARLPAVGDRRPRSGGY